MVSGRARRRNKGNFIGSVQVLPLVALRQRSRRRKI
jgi:hypothetical protein